MEYTRIQKKKKEKEQKNIKEAGGNHLAQPQNRPAAQLLAPPELLRHLPPSLTDSPGPCVSIASHLWPVSLASTTSSPPSDLAQTRTLPPFSRQPSPI
jgi:hypothetical protein